MKLYRYIRMTSKNLERTFKHCELYFAPPKDFIDPFDCNPPFSTTDYNKDDLRHYTRRTFLMSGISNSNPELEAITQKNVASILQNDNAMSHFAEHFNRVCLEVNSELGVLCLSEVRDDILMWSHYADGHRGIVLQFDKSRLLNKSDFEYCKKVDYENNIVTLKDMNRENPDELARLILLKKAERWKYEKEWRIIVDPSCRKDIPGCRILTFTKDALTGVIFGWKMSPEDKDAVHMWLKVGNHQVRIYQAISKAGAYSLEIDPMP